MAIYVPSAKVVVEIVDDPTSLPADLDAFPGFTVVPITRADLRSPVAINRAARRIERAAHSSSKSARGASGRTDGPSQQERKRLFNLICTGLELTNESETI